MYEDTEAQALFDNLYGGVLGQKPLASDLVKAALTLVVTALVAMPEDQREAELFQVEAVLRDAVEARLERDKEARKPHLRLVKTDREPA